MAGPNVARSRRLVLAMKVEGSYGVDAFAGTITAPDIVPAIDIAPTINIEEIPNLSTAGDIGRLPSVIGSEQAGVSFSQWFRGVSPGPFDDAPSRVVPAIDMPLRACALGAAFSVANASAWDKVTYAPTNTLESFTIYVIQEITGQTTGPAMKILGAQGTMGLRFRAGGVAVFSFTMTGAFGGRTDITYVGGSPGAAPQYPVLKSAAFQLDTTNYAPRIGNIGFDLGNVISPVPSINAAGAIDGFIITDRNPRLTIDPEAALVSSYDWITKWRGGSLLDCDFSVLGGAGSANYNKLKVIFPKLQIVQQGYSSRDNVTAWPTTLQATINAGLDDFSLECS
jgi:hypothetical protein